MLLSSSPFNLRITLLAQALILSSETAKNIPSHFSTSTLPDYDMTDLPFYATAKTNSLGSPFVSVTFSHFCDRKHSKEPLHGEAYVASQSEGTVHNCIAGMNEVCAILAKQE